MQVEHEPKRNRFVVRLPEGEGELAYSRPAPHTLDLVHTIVDPVLRGRGIGATLVLAALAYARQQKFRIIPTCPFVERVLADHPEERDLVVTRSAAT